jgi:hypothetical protein
LSPAIQKNSQIHSYPLKQGTILSIETRLKYYMKNSDENEKKAVEVLNRLVRMKLAV